MRGLVRVDVGVLDDDVLAGAAHRRHHRANVCGGERAAVEAEVEVSRPFHGHRGDEERQPEQREPGRVREAQLGVVQEDPRLEVVVDDQERAVVDQEAVLDDVRRRRDDVEREQQQTPAAIEERVGRDEERQPPVCVLRRVAGADGGDREQDQRGEQQRPAGIEVASRQHDDRCDFEREQDERKEDSRVSVADRPHADHNGMAGRQPLGWNNLPLPNVALVQNVSCAVHERHLGSLVRKRCHRDPRSRVR